MKISVAPHPLLLAAGFICRFESPLAGLDSPEWLTRGLRLDAQAPVERSEVTRQGVRDLLRHGGYKPTGRGKPASEYLARAAAEQTLGPINVAVDVCNVVSLQSGLPISLVDLERATHPLSIAIAPAGAAYRFNASGQEIDLGGLLCLFDSDGPCANAVKDSHRTKTTPETVETLSIIWGLRSNPDLLRQTVSWYREVVQRLGATCSDIELIEAPPESASSGPMGSLY